MSSINEVQIERVAKEIARYYFSTGVVPTDHQIMMALSDYFAINSVGLPLAVPSNAVASRARSDADAFNQALANTVLNYEVLYDTSESQVDDILNLFETFNTRLNSLNQRQARLGALVNDYLTSQSNSDGYYFSISDNFSDLSKTDLTLTSAYVNTSAGVVTLPSYSGATSSIPISGFGTPQISVTVDGSPFNNYATISPWSGATNSYDNMVWAIQVVLNQPSEVIVTVTFPIQQSTINQINFTPYGVVPVQAFCNAGLQVFQSNLPLVSFGNVVTSSRQIAFTSTPLLTNTVQITLRKTEPDQIDAPNGSTLYSYIFGAQNIQLIDQVYDTYATWVSTPLQFPSNLQNELVIHAVSMDTTATIAPGTSINYYVAADSGQTELTEFQWKPITPLSDAKQTSSTNQVVYFNGAQTLTKKIVPKPGNNDLQLIPLDPTNPDPTKANPTPNIIPGADLYKICLIPTNTSYRSISLLEGNNSTRIYHVPFSNAILSEADSWTNSTLIAGNTLLLSDWANLINSSSPPTLVYGQIDTGNSFFYGGDIGESGQNVYLETYLNIDSAAPPSVIVSNFIKSDTNSQSWFVNVYLNGSPVGSLPVGTNSLLIPWVFQAGLNHIALTIQIPEPTINIPNPYLGNVTLMADHNLYDFGRVFLNTWSEVSVFELQYNQLNDQPYFANINGLLVSRRAPASNFNISYALDTGQSPTALRVRADLTADNNISGVSPQFNAYQVRFAY